ncbi:adenine phosphoribosyltransferase [Burkholderia sp. WAC0059]|uniref:adenine phosphoribosyltransferase n=1 Tax=Burkholderia sp. WAC0059 TaxID=2066022 RepID=UPI000C7EBF2B|nr:adenine phosphoribosyltransferase [Burkholderia sp. WAC0059]PLZ03397.1 adenine phosphoribosyltransferase [Burkholderia sp. WAC0059]
MSHVPASASADAAQFIHGQIRTVPDWPQPGVQFRDITPLLRNPKALRVLIDLFVERYVGTKLDYVAGLDARGFIIGPMVAYELGLGFIPVRKAGKLPYRTVSETYTLEYGSATVEIHEDACGPGDRVVIVDDLIATGGTMLAGTRLLQRLGAQVVEGAAIIDLPDLGGSKRLTAAGLPLFTITSFGGH